MAASKSKKLITACKIPRHPTQTLLPVINRVNKLVLVRTLKSTRTFHCVRALQYARACYGKHCDKIRSTQDTGHNTSPSPFRECRKVRFVLTGNVVTAYFIFFTITITLQRMGNRREQDKYWTDGDTT